METDEVDVAIRDIFYTAMEIAFEQLGLLEHQFGTKAVLDVQWDFEVDSLDYRDWRDDHQIEDVV